MSPAVEVRERSIPMQAESVRGILDGSKTQTRRVVTPQPPLGYDRVESEPPGYGFRWENDSPPAKRDELGKWTKRCPYGQPGDRLYVREAWQYADWTEEGEPILRYRTDGETRVFLGNAVPDAWADRVQDVWAELSAPTNYAIDNRAADRRWRSPRFMPRWASRITLELTEVRAQRVQEIGVADCIAEGAYPMPSREAWNEDQNIGPEIIGAFRALWDSINAARGCSWKSNPWVWALSFRVVTP